MKTLNQNKELTQKIMEDINALNIINNCKYIKLKDEQIKWSRMKYLDKDKYLSIL